MTTRKRTPGESKPGRRLDWERSAGAVVFHRGEPLEYLLIFSTYWEFPKGMVEEGETEAEAAVREVGEETGLHVHLLPDFRHEIKYFYRRGDRLLKKTVVYFLGEAREKQVQISWEHREARWLEYDQAMKQLKYENARELLQKANDWLVQLRDEKRI